MQELHLHHEGCAGVIATAHVQDRELGTFHQRELLARKVGEAFDLLVSGALEKIVEEAPEQLGCDAKMRRKTKSFLRARRKINAPKSVSRRRLSKARFRRHTPRISRKRNVAGADASAPMSARLFCGGP
jgi:hypothetical protein